MMQAIGETIFTAAYLVTVLTLGAKMLWNTRSVRQYRLFGLMSIVLGLGDAFHLVPRAYALLTDGLAAYPAALGIGKLVTSITMTVFYLLLYWVWRVRYHVRGKQQYTVFAVALAVLRVALCAFPQNAWTSADPPLLWGIARNIPFALLGLMIIVLFFRKAHQFNDWSFRWMWLAISLSFAFYIPVVLYADVWPLVGTLMIPKTLCYVWVVAMGYRDMRKNQW